MKLVTYTYAGRTKPGVVLEEQVLDLEALPARLLAGGAWPSSVGSPSVPDMLSALQDWADFQPRISEIFNELQQADGETLDSLPLLPLEHVTLEAPVQAPGKVICVGLNYADHCREQNLETPERPILFAKFPTAVIGPGAAIEWPADASQKVDFEAELAIVIGKPARNVTAEHAYEYIAGYTIANDVSARDVQFSDGQWVRGKSFDTFCPLGPYLVTRDEVGDPHKLAIRLKVNGDLMQDSNTDQMIFKVPEILAFISHTCTLLPGDIICTGTPDGVGVFRKPQVFLKRGDIVEVEIEGLGRLRNPVG